MLENSTDRTERMSHLLADASDDDLRRIALQAVDHAHHASAEVAQAYALYEGAKGIIAEFADETNTLKGQVEELEEQLEAIWASRRWKLAGALTAPATVLRRRRR